MKEPLAYRMRPESLDEIVGQEHIIGKDTILYNAINTDTLTSVIFFGPPGCGKTTIANVIAKKTKYKFYKINAVTSGIADLKRIIEETENYLLNPDGKSILFIDEIHSFNKRQQDVLLPYVEKGEIILIGATTENPYFEINKALLSRSLVVELKPISSSSIVTIIKRAIKSEKGFKDLEIEISNDIIEKIAEISNGDIRYALSGFERAVLINKRNKKGKIVIDTDVLKNAFQQRRMLFDKNSSEHYDTISAFIKSVRGSDPQAAILYLAKMIESGEDPVFIARRLLILAAEDIGLANPNALNLAVNTMSAVKMIGMPESRIILAETTIYLCKCKKSNTAYMAINSAIEDVKKSGLGNIPMYLKNAKISGMEDLGFGVGYKYPHDYPKGIVEQEYLPKEKKGKKYYIDKWNNDIFNIKK